MGCGAAKHTSDIVEPQGIRERSGPGLFLIRNATSVYDYWSKNFSVRARRYKGDPPSETDPNYKFLEDVKTKWDKRLVDVSLHKRGEQEAIDARGVLSKLNVKYVFVSPLRRALETSRKMLEGLPNKEQLKIFVHPLLRPTLSNAKDLPMQLALVKKEYEAIPDLKYDFTLVNQESAELNDLYFLKCLNSPEKDTILEEIKKSGKPEDYFQVVAATAANKSKTGKKKMRRLETHENARRRAVQFGEYLDAFVKKAGLQKDDDVLIFTHGNIVRNCISVYWTPDGRSSAPPTQRCTIIPFDYAKLLELEKDFASTRVLRTGLTQELMPGGGLKGKEEKTGYLMPMQTCSRGHELFFSRNNDKGEAYDCIKCLKNGKTLEGRWHCLFCNYDLCSKCKEAPSAEAVKKLCNRGHHLEEMSTDDEVTPKFTCERCKKEGETKAGEKRWCCIGCAYDVCLNCV